MHNRSSLS
ncbi:hypothetical protein D041_0459A, partial [Vibrio parahaemolyticus EKP-008]